MIGAPALRLFLPILLFFGAIPAVYSQDFPALTDRVVDQADLLSPDEEAALISKLKKLEDETQRQLVVATISDLQDYDIADYGWRLGEHWGIGDKKRDDGMILIIAPNERRMRIEVGQELEAVLPDVLAGRIIRDDITPYFKRGDYAAGINAGTDKIITQLQLPPEQAAQIVREAKESRSGNDGENIGLILFWLFVLLFVILPILGSFRGGKKHRRKGSSGPVIIWGGGDWGGGSGGSSWGGGGGGSWGGGGFSGGGGGFGGGGASGGW
ncbi:TPM domain-containing protein [Sphingorhabdus arenilitoris]|uniref:TPM domain-containing protein n=1 Tax=Sphingorhabdus arenilitoris TaxID=1490041 RepID=A0ABV8RHR0_9SPHN